MLDVIAAGPEGETLDDIDRLFALPLDEFTSARNELARQLKEDGDAESAEQVRSLTKPSVPAWAINQLARRDEKGVRSLLNVAARLRSAQERSLRGERAADELRSAQAEERELLRRLTQRAAEVLREAGRPATGATLDRVSSTLRAAAVAEPGRTSLRAGQLTGDVEVSGFDAFADVEVPAPGRRASRSGDDLGERRRQKREAERQRRTLEKRVRELTGRAETAEREAERARKQADEAEAVAAERRREADAAAAELESHPFE
jgi:hypothetical protein